MSVASVIEDIRTGMDHAMRPPPQFFLPASLYDSAVAEGLIHPNNDSVVRCEPVKISNLAALAEKKAIDRGWYRMFDRRR